MRAVPVPESRGRHLPSLGHGLYGLDGLHGPHGLYGLYARQWTCRREGLPFVVFRRLNARFRRCFHVT